MRVIDTPFVYYLTWHREKNRGTEFIPPCGYGITVWIGPEVGNKKQALRGSLPWWSEGSCRTADHVCEFVNRFPADRRKVEVSLFFVVFETACGFMGRAHRSAPQRYLLPPPLRTKTVTIRFFSFGLQKK